MSRTVLQEFCRQAILSDLGKLDDIPYELANTVANTYYRFFASAKAPPPSFDSIEQSEAATAAVWRASLDFELAPQMVRDLRKIKSRGAHPTVVNAAAQIALSHLKYRIENVEEKSLARLKIYAFLKRPTVNEIAGLVDTLELR